MKIQDFWDNFGFGSVSSMRIPWNLNVDVLNRWLSQNGLGRHWGTSGEERGGERGSLGSRGRNGENSEEMK